MEKEETCELCFSEISAFYLNKKEAIKMCVNLECKYPFNDDAVIKITSAEEAAAIIQYRKIKKAELRMKSMKKNKRRKKCTSSDKAISESPMQTCNLDQDIEFFDIEKFLNEPIDKDIVCDDIADIIKEIEEFAR